MTKHLHRLKQNPFKSHSLCLSQGKHLLIGAGWKKQPLTPCYVVGMFLKKLPNFATSDHSFRKQRRPPAQALTSANFWLHRVQAQVMRTLATFGLHGAYIAMRWSVWRGHSTPGRWSMVECNAILCAGVLGPKPVSLFREINRQFNWLNRSSGAIHFLHDVACDFVGGAWAWTTGWTQLRRVSCKVAALQSQGFQLHRSS